MMLRTSQPGEKGFVPRTPSIFAEMCSYYDYFYHFYYYLLLLLIITTGVIVIIIIMVTQRVS